MLKKGHALLFIVLTWCLMLSSPVLAACRYDSEAVFPRTLRDWAGADGMCWFCPVFETLFRAINKLVTEMSKNMSGFFLTMMSLGILFFIAFKVGKMVIQLQEVDLMQFLGDMFKTLGRAIIATALLAAMTFQGDTIYSLLIQPVFDLSLMLANEVMNTSVAGTEAFTATQAGGVVNTSGGAIMQACTYNETLPDNMAFTTLELRQIICWMRTVCSSLGVGIAVGSTFMKLLFVDFLRSIHLFLPGFIIFCAFFVCYITFPFLLFDGIIRFAFIMTLMPLWIILWVFPITAEYTKKAWNMFLNTCVLFIALSVIVAMVVQIMNGAIQPDHIRQQLFEELSCGKTDGAVKQVDAGGRALFIILAMGALSWTILGTAASLSNAFVDGGGELGVNKGMSAAAVKGAKAGYKLGKAGTRLTGRAVKGAARRIREALDDRKSRKIAELPPAPKRVYESKEERDQKQNELYEQKMAENQQKKQEAIQSGTQNVVNNSHNADKYDEVDKKMLMDLGQKVHSGQMKSTDAQAAFASYLAKKSAKTGVKYDNLGAKRDISLMANVHREADLKYDAPIEQQKQTYNEKTASLEIARIMNINKGADARRKVCGREEADRWREEQLKIMMSESQNVYTEKDQKFLTNLADTMNKKKFLGRRQDPRKSYETALKQYQQYIKDQKKNS